MDQGTTLRPRFRAVNVQGWHDLTFLHWPYAPEVVQALLPPGLEVETADGAAWVGVTPFRMHAVRPAGLPPLPHISFFPEVNTRTYVRHANGSSGVWFLSLDTPRLPVIAALRTLGLPYMWARQSVALDPHRGLPARRVAYRSHRLAPRRASGPPARLRALIEVGSPIPQPQPLVDFLTARWWAFTMRAGRLWQVPAEHPPWPLHEARGVLVEAEELLRAGRLPPPDGPVLVHFSPGVRSRLGLPRPS